MAGSSVTRVFNSLTSVINFAISEYALDVKNPFSRVYYDRSHKVKKRLPVPLEVIRDIQNECYHIDDDMRWLIALISDTGMRLSEAAGLHKDDIVLGDAVPHLIVQSHPWRGLKTGSSERHIPLVGASLWATQRIIHQSYQSKLAFPRYNRQEQTNGNSASAALNKWLKSYLPAGCSIHSFRHSLRDRLRSVGCPSGATNNVGGWSQDNTGAKYGTGYTLQHLNEFMKKIVL